MNAAVGPPICTRLPPRREMRKPAMTAVRMPSAGAGSGVAAPAGMLAMPSASASGRAISPTVMPEVISLPQSTPPAVTVSKERGRNGRRPRTSRMLKAPDHTDRPAAVKQDFRRAYWKTVLSL